MQDRFDDKEIIEQILAVKEELGEKLLILTHHLTGHSLPNSKGKSYQDIFTRRDI